MSEEDDAAVDPADRPQRDMAKNSDRAGVPLAQRASNAGGTMSETIRSREADLDDEIDQT